MLLAIDTATRTASVALYDASGVLAEQSWRSDNRHTVEVAPAIAAMLDRLGRGPEALRGVAVAVGPGSFTGLRIGISLAKGLCLALRVPILGVPSLDVAAYAAGDPGGPVVAVLEAGRGRLCVARYRFEDGLPTLEGEMSLVRSTEWTPAFDELTLVAGEVSPELAEHLLSLPEAENVVISSLASSVRRAGYLAELAWERLEAGACDDLDSLAPIYLHQPTSGGEVERG